MSATSNRFEALSEEDEIEFVEDGLSMHGSESYESDDTLMEAQSSGRPGRKKAVSFKTVKKRSKKQTKTKMQLRSPNAAVTPDTKVAHSETNLLYRSTLASTFRSASPALVTLSKPRSALSGRGGGLHGSSFSPSAKHTLASGFPTSTIPVSQQFMGDQCQDAITGEVADAPPQQPPPACESSLQQVLKGHSINPEESSAVSTTSVTAPVLLIAPPYAPTSDSPATQESPTSSSVPASTTASVNGQESALPVATSFETASDPAQHLANTLFTSSDPASTQVSQASQTASKSTVTTTRPKSTLRLHTFQAQLTFGLKPSQKVNVADLFTSWIDASLKLLSDFALLPFEDVVSDTITSIEHIAHGDPEFFMKYYGNHRSLIHGNLTGMVHFQTSTSWQSIKAFRSRYFAWLTNNRVFINYTMFKTETLVPCGFLVGAHPGHFRRKEAEEELLASLGLDPGELSFQLSSHSVSVPIKEDDPRRYSFNAVVVETSTKHATRLCERFYELSDPSKAISDYPYTGLYQFVPMVKSTDWPIQKIYQLAHLHSSIIDDLKTIYVHHIQDVNNVVDDSGYSLLQGFYGMTVTGQPSTDPKDRLI
jgi:hypothetical protein